MLDTAGNRQDRSGQGIVHETKRGEQIFQALLRVNTGGCAENNSVGPGSWVQSSVRQQHTVGHNVDWSAEDTLGARCLRVVLHNHTGEARTVLTRCPGKSAGRATVEAM